MEDQKINEQKKGLRVNFLELIAHFGGIEIPMIQRDYAQGRTSAKTVRYLFLEKLFNTIKTCKPLNLDFVYGSKVNGYFQPIDGQQRLTTLFLLHWFLAHRSDEFEAFKNRLVNDESKETRFRYSVRKSSSLFFDQLLQFSPEITEGSKKISEQVENQPWFFRSWRLDPTIRGALVMLDDLSKKFSSDECSSFYQKLATDGSELITMDVLDIGVIGLSDEIYIKMNDRGKELTGFEKFKSWLIGVNGEFEWPANAIKKRERWQTRLDTDWLDLFWNLRSENAEATSKGFFRTFIALAINYYASVENGYTHEKNNQWLEIDNKDQLDRPDLWVELFEKNPKSNECLTFVFNSLSEFSRKDSAQLWPIHTLRAELQGRNFGSFTKMPGDDIVFFEGESGDDDPPTFRERAWLHAICIFQSQLCALPEIDKFHWFRVIRNLLQHTGLESRNFSNIIKSIEKLSKDAVSLSSVLCAVQNTDILTGIDTDQLDEEKRKAELILDVQNGREWEFSIVQAEAHPVLIGQIDFLLPEDGPTSLSSFKKRLSVLEAILGKGRSKIAPEKHMLMRAALACSNDIETWWQRKINLSEDLSNWRTLISRDSQCKELRMGTIRLIDSLLDNEVDETVLSRVCSSQLTDNNEGNWFHDIIRHGDILLRNNCSRDKKIQQYYDHGIFVFAQSNYCPDYDILIGKHARWRNDVIRLLLKNGWVFTTERTSREVEGTELFMGHQLALNHHSRLWTISTEGTVISLAKIEPSSIDSNELGSEFSGKQWHFRMDEQTPESPPEEIVEYLMKVTEKLSAETIPNNAVATSIY